MTSESTNWKGSISEAETSDDGEPRLQIVDPFETEHPGSTNRLQINRPTFQVHQLHHQLFLAIALQKF